MVGSLSTSASRVVSVLKGPGSPVSFSHYKLMVNSMRSKGASACATLVGGTTSTKCKVIVLLANAVRGLEHRARKHLSTNFIKLSDATFVHSGSDICVNINGVSPSISN